MFDISLAEDSNRDEIVSFIKNHWKADHIFVRESNYFTYEMASGGSPQFVIAKKDGALVGVVGFIQYAPDVHNAELFLVLLRVLESYAKHGLAIKLLQFCISLTSRDVHTVGANPAALPLYQFAGFRVGQLDHYCWINPDIATFSLAQPGSNQFVNPDPGNFIAKNLAEMLSPIDYDTIEQNGSAEKTRWYFNKRYFEHPIFDYNIVSIRHESGLQGIGVYRVVEYGDASVVRIVDWVGSSSGLPGFLKHACGVCLDIQAEYVDIYLSETDAEFLSAAGFNPTEDGLVAPNYFQPLVQKNVLLTFATTCKTKLRLLRGDGDQDRPS